MKRNIYLFTLTCGVILSMFCNRGYSQISLTADSTTCGATSTTLHATLLGDVPTASGITADDGYSSVINIGFTFNFYGTNYTQLLIGSNGCLCFDLSLAGGYNPWPITAALAGNSSAYNSICGPWCDIYIPAGGTITYSSIGTAPYRKFMVTFCTTAMYSCTSQWTTTQMIIYETTNIVEAHIGHKTICAGWNGGYAIVGVQNASGSASTVAPSRDYPTDWTGYDEAWRFTPSSSGSSYTCSSITYAPVPFSSSTICWYDSTTGAFLGTGSSLTVTPTGGSGTYYATAAGCADSTFAYIHVDLNAGAGATVGNHINGLTFTNPSVCGACDGTIRVLGGLTPGVADTVYFKLDTVLQPAIYTVAGSDSSVTLTGMCAGTYSDIYVADGNPCPTNTVGPITLVNPPVHAAFTVVPHLGCTSDQVVLTNNSTPSGFSSIWTFGDGSAANTTTSPTYTYVTQGIYTITLVYNTYGAACYDTITQTVDLNHPLSSSFTSSSNYVCLGTPITFTNTSVAGGPSYLWSFGDGTTSNSVNPIHTYLQGGMFNVTLTVTDTIPCSAVSNTTIEVVSITAKTGFKDTTVCLRQPMPLFTTVTVIPDTANDITYQWTPGTNLSNPTINQPTFTGTGDYTYTFTATALPLGCVSSDVETIHSEPPLVMTNITDTQYINLGASVQLNANSAWIYEWSPNDGTLSNPNINNPVATPTDSFERYMVVGMTPYGCKDTSYVVVYTDLGTHTLVPSGFTPNGDGKNDIFRLFDLQYQKLVEFRVFNRWGKEMFATSDAMKGWDGTYNGVPQDIGTYYYEITVDNPDGNQKTFSGSVTLVR